VAGMKFGLYGLLRGIGVEPDLLVRRARLAEDAGFESLWVGDHIALPPEEGGKDPRLEVVVALSHLAAVTSRIRLGFGVLVLPQRQPVLLARQVSSLDHLSRGRVTVGIGVGYVEPELAAMGVTRAERGARTDEYLAAMRALWTGEPAFRGRWVSYDDVHQRPLPVQRPYPPVVVGGHSTGACRRAVTAGNGWFGVYLDVAEAAEALGRLRAVAADCDRPADLGPLEITVTPPGPVDLDTARRYADLGVDRLVITPTEEDGSGIEAVIDSVAALAGRV